MSKLLSRGMLTVLIAQFFSALADNALLFAAIAILQAHTAPDWQVPLLQAAFVIAFIVLAPFVGPFADAWPKGRVMLVGNTIKIIGAASMLLGVSPLIAYSIVGVGAAAYSPAKYGILSELVGADKLVKANGVIEGSTVVAILLGVVIGGKLADASVNTALIFTCCCYMLATVANILIPRLAAMQPLKHFSPTNIIKQFFIALTKLYRNPDARLALLGNSVFWGTGSTLRLLLVAWVPIALNISDLAMPANLSGAVAIGIAIGATVAASLISLKNVNRVLPAGMLIGLIIIALGHTTHLYLAITLLIMLGVCGGFFVVPLNALLQERGHQTVGAGQAVAVQNFFENFAMLGFVGLYSFMEKIGLPATQSAIIFGSMVLIAIALLSVYRLKTKYIEI